MNDDPSANRSGHLFPQTTWTFIQRAQQLQDDEYIQARNEFLSRYMRPVLYYLRARGYKQDRAEDLTQGFFERFLEQDAFRRADRQRGRFRTFLLSVLGHFLSDQNNWRRQTLQTQFERRCVTVSALVTEDDRRFEPVSHETPEFVFMKQWALSLMRSVQARLEVACIDRGHPEWYRVFATELAHPEWSRERMAQHLGLTIHQVRYAQQMTHPLFADLLKAAVRDHVDSDADVMDEIRELQSILEGACGPPSEEADAPSHIGPELPKS